jgi:hypothetical protein
MNANDGIQTVEEIETSLRRFLKQKLNRVVVSVFCHQGTLEDLHHSEPCLIFDDETWFWCTGKSGEFLHIDDETIPKPIDELTDDALHGDYGEYIHLEVTEHPLFQKLSDQPLTACNLLSSTIANSVIGIELHFGPSPMTFVYQGDEPYLFVTPARHHFESLRCEPSYEVF